MMSAGAVYSRVSSNIFGDWNACGKVMRESWVMSHESRVMSHLKYIVMGHSNVPSWVMSYKCMYVRAYVRMYVCIYVQKRVCRSCSLSLGMEHAFIMHVCMHVCTYACTYVRTYVCLCMYTYVCKQVSHRGTVRGSHTQTLTRSFLLWWLVLFSQRWYTCSALQCVAVCCSVLQCVALCCGVLQCPH